MTNLTGILLFSVVIILALGIVSMANRVQTRNRVIRLKTQRLRARMVELEDICLSISPLLDTPSVPKLINEEVIDLIRSMIQLDNEASTLLEANLENALNLEKVFDSGQTALPMDRIQPSDAAIAKQQYYLSEAGKIVRRHHSLARIQDAEMNAHIQELSWAHLMVGVVAHVAQGHQGVNRNDPMVAFGHYRNAQAILINANQNDEKGHRWVREIRELMTGERFTISTDLMPETEFNPTQSIDFSHCSQ